jgi:hypothetical protein
MSNQERSWAWHGSGSSRTYAGQRSGKRSRYAADAGQARDALQEEPVVPPRTCWAFNPCRPARTSDGREPRGS